MAVFYFGQNNKPKTTEPIPTITVTPTAALKNSLDFEYKDKKYRVSWIKIADINKLTLLPNFTDQLSSQNLIKNNNCQRGISAGFYDTQNKPLGLFIAEEETMGKEINSNFINTILFVTTSQKPGISIERPEDHLRLAVQSGPLLLQNNQPLFLKIIDDKMARRIAAGLTNDQELIFLAIYDKDSPLLGPYLADMPQIMKLVSEKIGIPLENALNLDGGTASAFHGQNINLSEFVSVGALFCVK